MTRAVVLSDTHIGPRSKRRLPQAVYVELERADVILHAGDIVVAEVLHELSGFAPVHAVLGNNDDGELAAVLPERLEVDLDGVAVAMVHISGQKEGRQRRLRAMFPEAAVVVFGHSHIPWNEAGLEGQWLFNPGSPTDRRRQPSHTFGTLDVEAGRLVRAEILVCDP